MSDIEPPLLALPPQVDRQVRNQRLAVTISRLYDNYAGAQRGVTRLEAAGVPHTARVNRSAGLLIQPKSSSFLVEHERR